jgi:PAS domain S-box-containing protein
VDPTDHSRPFSGVIDFLPDATFVIDTAGTVIAWNRAMTEMTGVSAGEMIGKAGYEYAIPFYGERKPMLANLALMPTEELEARYHSVQKEGETLVVDIFIPGFQGRGAWFWAKASPLYDGAGTIIGAIESIRDITDRKQLEEAMAGSRKRLAEIIDFLPDATFVIDTAGTVIAWNRAMTEMTGAGADEMIGKAGYEYAIPFYGERKPMLANLALMPTEELEARYHSVRKEGETLVVDIFIPEFQGRGAWFWAKASPLYDESGCIAGAVESIRDITERRELEERMARAKAELDIAAEIQRSFLPQSVPRLQGFEIAARNVMAKEVGGDFFDVIPFEVIPLSPEKLGLLVADVSGKGIPAALFMALSRIVIRVHALLSLDPVTTITRSNAVITRDSHSGMFVTLFYGILSESTRTLEYVNAGHNPPLMYRKKTGSLEELVPTGMALGAMEPVIYDAQTVRFGSGDVLLLYTDGITDAMNAREEFYGIERLCSLFRASTGSSADDMLHSVLEDVARFRGDFPLFDDITLMVIKAGEGPEQ